MKACFQIAECSLASAKIMQMSAMKACFQIAECSLASAKILKKTQKSPLSRRKSVTFNQLRYILTIKINHDLFCIVCDSA